MAATPGPPTDRPADSGSKGRLVETVIKTAQARSCLTPLRHAHTPKRGDALSTGRWVRHWITVLDRAERFMAAHALENGRGWLPGLTHRGSNGEWDRSPTPVLAARRTTAHRRLNPCGRDSGGPWGLGKGWVISAHTTFCANTTQPVPSRLWGWVGGLRGLLFDGKDPWGGGGDETCAGMQGASSGRSTCWRHWHEIERQRWGWWAGDGRPGGGTYLAVTRLDLAEKSPRPTALRARTANRYLPAGRVIVRDLTLAALTPEVTVRTTAPAALSWKALTT